MQDADGELTDFALQVKQLLIDNCVRAYWNGRPKTDGTWYIRAMLKNGATREDILQAASTAWVKGWIDLEKETATVTKMRKIREQRAAAPAPAPIGIGRYDYLLPAYLRGRG